MDTLIKSSDSYRHGLGKSLVWKVTLELRESQLIKGYPVWGHVTAIAVLAGGLFGMSLHALGEESASKQLTVSQQLTASQMMQIAHDGRAEWVNLPGFDTKLTLSTDTARGEGRLHVSPDGKMDLTLPPGDGFQWAQRALKSVVGHRLTVNDAITTVEFADQQVDHPHGRLLRSTNPEEKSLWRVQGDVMTEVHRITDTSRLIISISDVLRTPEGKHLPQNFSVTTWELPSNQIKSARQVHQGWVRIDGVDLPSEFWAITNYPDGTSVTHRVEFSEHRLLPRSTSN